MSIVKLNNRGVRSVTAFGSLSSGAMTFIKKLTASSSSTLSFVDGSSDVVLDNTYKEYLFTFNNIHPATDGANFTFQGNASGGSGYNETLTTTSFRAYHDEAGSDAAFSYEAGNDQAQGTAFQQITDNIGNVSDESASGTLHLFNPSSTTFVKHFIARTNTYQNSNYSMNTFTAGYFNTTSAIDEIQFKMNTGNIDAGDICLYGIN
tara:strand:- start:3 stop:620 length:618 start_codon:yes stop_codon:yes gene_type:complete